MKIAIALAALTTTAHADPEPAQSEPKEAQPEPILHGTIHAFYVDIAVFDQTHGLARDQALQTIHDEARDLFLQHDRRLAD